MNSCLTKQTDVCPLSGTVSVALADNYKYEMGEGVVVTAKRILYKRYGNDIYVHGIILRMNYSKNLIFMIRIN